jgi:multiple sugar transport system ATP-binding protein
MQSGSAVRSGAMTRGASIELRGLSKSYDGTTVIEGVDLSIEPGELLVLVGPSGCGKSTLLRCIAGLEEISDGTLLIDGRRANDVHPKDRDLAMVFQSYALYPHMTVARNMGFSLTVRKMKRAEVDARVRAAAERLGLSGMLDRHPRQLSGGQRQRVALGRAIVRQPRAFLFDEPLSNLDAALRGLMRIELKKLHRELDATMIYVTHDQVEAMTLADRIALLEGGRLRQVGTPAEIFERPSSRFVAGFIGSPPMNFLEGRCDPAVPEVSGDGFRVPLGDDYRGVRDAPFDVTVGVRPTALALGGEGPGLITATVDVKERLGWETYVHVKVGARQAVAQVESARSAELEAGEQVAFGVAPAAVHLFEADTGDAIFAGT